MKPSAACLFALLCLVPAAGAQQQDIKFIADTLVVQAEGRSEADPDLATLTFDITAENKELKAAYERAAESMQKIVALTEKNGLRKEDVASSALTVTPKYGGDSRKRAKSFLVRGQVTLKVRDFSKLGALLESSADETTEFHSLTYALADEEIPKQQAVTEAMRRAMGRAKAALEQKGQHVGALRFANLDVRQLPNYAVYSIGTMAQTVEVFGNTNASTRKTASAPLPTPPQPEKITVTATVQCAFQIQ